jgi:hypothetical protein
MHGDRTPSKLRSPMLCLSVRFDQQDHLNQSGNGTQENGDENGDHRELRTTFEHVVTR